MTGTPEQQAALAAELRGLSKNATPIPWRIGGTCEGNYLYGAVQPNGAGEHLACISSRKDDGLGGDDFMGPDTSEACANASLIAALRNNIPTILAALTQPREAEMLVPEAWIFDGPQGQREVHGITGWEIGETPEGWMHTPLFRKPLTSKGGETT